MKFFRKKNSIYLDYAAAAPLDGDVARLMHATEELSIANASAIHAPGVASRKIIADARSRIAALFHVHPDEIIFTGSGTESDALAIIGVITNYEPACPADRLHITDGNQKNKIPHIVTTNIEHPAVLENCRLLEAQGRAEVTYVEVRENGIVDPKDIKEALRENTILVSCMYANNEIGTIQPIRDIAKEIRHFRKSRANSSFPLFHTDACQAANYVPMGNMEKLGVDLLSLNGSKIYGPKGIGVLYKKRGVALAPLYEGGGQEFGLRPGTENVSLIAGVALALEKAVAVKEKENSRLTQLRDYGVMKLLHLSGISGYDIVLNGDPKNRLPNNINISISEISSELLVIELDAKGIYVSSKSACKSDEPDESYVIAAVRMAQGKRSDTVDGSLRITLGRQTRRSDIDALVKNLGRILDTYKKWK
ncbi:MAG: cysteine desulfurase family protein [Patescibacteria group bacterium]